MTQPTHFVLGLQDPVGKRTQSKDLCLERDVVILEELFRYETTFVFNNDFPALLEDVPEPEDTGDPLFKYVAFCFVMLLPDPSMNSRVSQKDKSLNFGKYRIWRIWQYLDTYFDLVSIGPPSQRL